MDVSKKVELGTLQIATELCHYQHTETAVLPVIINITIINTLKQQ